jgi:hypothetical protein
MLYRLRFFVLIPVAVVACIILTSCPPQPITDPGYITVSKGSSFGDPAYSRKSSEIAIRLQLQNDSSITADELELEFAVEFASDPNAVYYITDHYITPLKAGVKKDYTGYFYETDSIFTGNPFVSISLWRLSMINFYNYNEDTVKPVYEIPYKGAAYTLFSK